MNPFEMFKNLGQLQEQLAEVQRAVKEIRVTGVAGGDLVTVEMSGEFHLLSVKIADELMDPSESTMLADLVVAAHNDAVARVRTALQEQFGGMLGDLPIPPGLFGGGA